MKIQGTLLKSCHGSCGVASVANARSPSSAQHSPSALVFLFLKNHVFRRLVPLTFHLVLISPPPHLLTFSAQ